MGLKAKVEAVSANKGHTFTKVNMDRIRVVRDHGVEADAHFGTTVQHLHLIKKDPTRPNLRQVAPDRAREDSRMERSRSPCPMRFAGREYHHQRARSRAPPGGN